MQRMRGQDRPWWWLRRSRLGRSLGWSGTEELEPIARLWILRTLVELGAQGDFVQNHGFRDTIVAAQLGLGQLDGDEDGFDADAARRQLRQMFQQCEGSSRNLALPLSLADNLERLAALVGLTEVEKDILGFVVLLHSVPSLERAFGLLGELTSRSAIEVIARILHRPLSEIGKALKPRATLSESGLVRLDREFSRPLGRKIDLLSDSFADTMILDGIEPIDLLRDIVLPAPPPELGLENYDHLSDELSLLLPYLKRCLRDRRVGVNILMYGPPGTGKSQLVRVLAQELGCDLFEVSSEDEDGDPVNGGERLRALRAAQFVFKQSSALIAFDEVEDVFAEGASLFGRTDTQSSTKAWINRALEGNQRSTFWLSNNVGCLDPAFIRRFDFALEMPVPSKRQRERIVASLCAGLGNPRTVSRLAANERLSPAVIARATRIVATVRDQLSPERLASSIEMLVRNTLVAQGHDPDVPGEVAHSCIYDPALVETDTDLEELGSNLHRVGAGRICLFGPAGTGKTAFARWLADRIERPLIVKRASDLLGAFVGENEKNIAGAFRQARRDDAVLLIDEVETFLNDRRGARHGWEASLVNEMLTQMESFEGTFIASTNMVDVLDVAALRRFDLKVRFDYLRTEQARELLRRHCRALGLGEPCLRSLHVLAKLYALTPGDFAVVARRSRLTAIRSPEAFAAALSEECRLKDGGRREIGFAIA